MNTYIKKITGLITQMWNSEGLRATALVSGGNIIGSGLSAVAMLIISRRLGPKDFGIFSAAFSLLLLVSRVIDLGVNLAIQREMSRGAHGDRRHFKRYVVNAGLIKVLSCGLLVVLGWVYAPVIAVDWLHIDDVNLIRASIILSTLTIFYEFYVSTIQALHRFSEAAIISVSQGVVKFVSILGLIKGGQLNVSLAFYTYALTPGLVLLPMIRHLEKFSGSWQVDTDLMKRIWQAAQWMSIAIISAALADSIDILLIQRFLNSQETGLYSAASKITLFVNLISLSLITVLSVRVARYHQIEHLNAYIRKAKWVALAGFIGTALLIPVSGFLVYFTVGNEYEGGISSLSWLLLASGLSTATGPYAALFYLFDRPMYYAWSGILLMVSLIAFDWIMIPIWGIDGAGMAKLIARLLVLVFTLVYVRISYVKFVEGKKKT